MARSIARVALGAVAGAVAGVVALFAAYAFDPWIVVEMDRAVAPMVSGVYAPERDGQTTFAWTGREAVLRLPGLDRRHAWSCTIRLRGARQDPSALPLVDVAVDGITIATHATTNEYVDVTVGVPARPRATGATVAVTASATFEPGPADSRTLGVMIDRWTCVPAGHPFVWPPSQARRAAALAGAIAGAGFAGLGLPLLALAAATLLVAGLQAGPLAAQLAPFSPYVARVPWLALWTTLLVVAFVRGGERLTRRPWSLAARAAAVVTTAACYLKLLALLHPSKPVVDALFQAHRLEWVLAGRYYFTQVMPGGVEFPYAIGLYLVAAVWSPLTTDHVTLLRVVVIGAEAGAGALLYGLAARFWHDRLAGVLAVAAFSLVPLPYVIVGNGNLTNAFAQSMALATMAAAIASTPHGRRAAQGAGLTLITALALASHISTFVLLPALLVCLTSWLRWLGGPASRDGARMVLAATVAAVALSTLAYYGHFGDTYRTALRVRAHAAPVVATPGDDTADAAPTGTPPLATSWYVRAGAQLGHTRAAMGWPLLLLAAAGVWQVWRARARDPLACALLAWGTLYVALFVAGTLTRVDAQFERYSVEFMGRVDLATYPAVALLAARGAAWAWRAGALWRLVAVALLLGALRTGLDAWLLWLR